MMTAALQKYYDSIDLRRDVESVVLRYPISVPSKQRVAILVGQVLESQLPLENLIDEVNNEIGDSKVAAQISAGLVQTVFRQFMDVYPEAQPLYDTWYHMGGDMPLTEAEVEKLVAKAESLLSVENLKIASTIAPQNPKLPLQRAMTEYPMLGQQTISSEMVKLRSQIAPVRGTLYNWIKAYRDELGVRKHDTIERTNFLFTSENGKKLTSEEKDRMHHVIEALEDGVAVEVDAKRQAIVWPGGAQSPRMPVPSIGESSKSSSVPLQSLQSQERVVEDAQIEITAAPYTASPVSVAATGTLGKVSFSTNHVLPSETPEYTGSELVDTWLAENQTPAADPVPTIPQASRNMRM